MNARSENPNLAQLLSAAAKLEPLLDEIVFVGGCVTGLLLSDLAAAPVRTTLDVDAIVAIVSYVEFIQLENRLRELGFRESRAEGAPVCRWLNEDLILDLMPSNPSILGFSNRWYGAALEHANKINIGKWEIRIVSAPYFLATKMEAFHGRGKNDFRTSHDMEDIITVIDGRSEIIEEVHVSGSDLQEYLRDEFKDLLLSRDFLEALPGHLLPDAASQQRLGIILNRIQQIIDQA